METQTLALLITAGISILLNIGLGVKWKGLGDLLKLLVESLKDGKVTVEEIKEIRENEVVKDLKNLLS